MRWGKHGAKPHTQNSWGGLCFIGSEAGLDYVPSLRGHFPWVGQPPGKEEGAPGWSPACAAPGTRRGSGLGLSLAQEFTRGGKVVFCAVSPPRSSNAGMVMHFPNVTKTYLCPTPNLGFCIIVCVLLGCVCTGRALWTRSSVSPPSGKCSSLYNTQIQNHEGSLLNWCCCNVPGGLPISQKCAVG